MALLDDILNEEASKTPDEEPAVPLTLDLVGAAEAADMLGIGRAALWERRRQHEKFPKPVAELRCGPIWLRWQIQHYAAEEARLGPRGWYGRRLRPRYRY
jgi:predicted DNA-binding transcriptional regulator AlpA